MAAGSSISSQRAAATVEVTSYTNGLLGPGVEMLGPVADGGTILGTTAPGCWGPMITPEIRGGHEVTRPVAVAGAEVGDSVVLEIKKITVDSAATASGNDEVIEGRFLGDPYVAGKCPGCGELYPRTHVEGIGATAIRCDACGADAAPFRFTNGYTITFDERRTLGVTLHAAAAERIARDGRRYAAIPGASVQNSVLSLAPHDLVGIATRLRPFMGQLGTSPGITMPDSHNAGDFGSFLIGAPHEYALTAHEIGLRTDGHMDIDAVREGAVLICPVKLPGAGIYMGDMHALQGDGEIAGHTCDVAGTIELEVGLLKGIEIDGPILLPVLEDLPFLARPLTADERARALTIARDWGLEALEESLPISIVGSGPDLNSATDNGLQRAADLLDMTVPEVKNRATITGGIEIGRHPGVVQVTLRAPTERLAAAGLLAVVERQYGDYDGA